MTTPRADRLQTAVWAGAALALVGLFWLLSPILTPFVVGAVFAYICDPAVSWLARHKVPRTVAVLLVISTMGLVLITLTLVLMPLLYREAVSLIRRMPDLIELFNLRVSPLLMARLGIDIELDAEQFRSWMAEHWDSAQELLPILLNNIKAGGLALIGTLATLFLIPIVMFYLLQEWPRILSGLQNVVPRPWLETTMRVIGDVDRVLSEFLRGQMSVMVLLAVYYSVGLWIAGLSFALPVGVLTGLLAFIPFIGFGGGLLLAIASALLQGDGWSVLIWVGVVYSLGQVIESYVLTPYLVGERIGLHPLAVIFALMAFGQLFGFVGVLVALPVSAALLVGLREVSTAWFTSPVYLGKQDDA